jgi:hypothetical protein
MPDRSLASPKFLDAVFDELIDKRCNHYREMMGCLLSGSRRVRQVIVGCSTASPAQAIAINVLYDGCSLDKTTGELTAELSPNFGDGKDQAAAI